MLRQYAIGFAICLLFFAGCGGHPAISGSREASVAAAAEVPVIDSQASQPSPATVPQPTPAPAQLPTPAPTPTPTPTPSPEPSPEPEQIPAPEKNPTSAVGITLPDEIISPWAEQYIGGDYNKKYSWYFTRNSDHQPPGAQREFDIREYDAYYLGDIHNKEVYLTFDQGYEAGFTEKILDTLREKNVTAAFFLTGHYINSSPDLVARMVTEGHVVANHTVKHPSLPGLSDGDVILELTGLEDLFRDMSGLELDKFMRPPMGEYSPRVLGLAQDMGYRTIFWSFAYLDWETDNQPSPAYAYNQVMNNLHNGAIILLHAVSSANAEALGDIIDSAKELGFEFKSLYEL